MPPMPVHPAPAHRRQTQACELLLLGNCHWTPILWWFFFFFRLCCPLRFQSSPLTPPVRGFPIVWKLFNLHDSLPRMRLCPEILCLSFSLYLLSYLILKRLVCLSGIWDPPLAFRSCSVQVAPHADDLSMYLWGIKWSPHPIPPPSWDHLPLLLHFTLKHQIFLKNYYICSHLHWSTCTISTASLKSLTFYVLPAFSHSIPILILNKWDTFLSQPVS